MPRHAHYVPHGVIPAVLLPFADDLSIDEKSFRKHLSDVAAAEGLSGHHHQRPFDRGRLLQLRRTAPRPRYRAGRDRRPAADRQRRLGRRQPRSRAHRPHGGGGRRLRAAGVPAGAVHARPVAGHGDRALQAHRRRHEPAADRLPVSAGDRAGLSARHAPEDGRGGADHPRHQGLGRQRAAARDAYPRTAKPQAAGQRADHPQRLAAEFAGARLQRASLRLGQRHRRSAIGAVPRGQGQRPRRGAAAQRPHLSAGARVLCRPLGRHAQPHEGGVGAARPPAARRGAAAAGQDRPRRDRPHPRARWSRPGCCRKSRADAA